MYTMKAISLLLVASLAVASYGALLPQRLRRLQDVNLSANATSGSNSSEVMLITAKVYESEGECSGAMMIVNAVGGACMREVDSNNEQLGGGQWVKWDCNMADNTLQRQMFESLESCLAAEANATAGEVVEMSLCSFEFTCSMVNASSLVVLDAFGGSDCQGEDELLVLQSGCHMVMNNVWAKSECAADEADIRFFSDANCTQALQMNSGNETVSDNTVEGNVGDILGGRRRLQETDLPAAGENSTVGNGTSVDVDSDSSSSTSGSSSGSDLRAGLQCMAVPAAAMDEVDNKASIKLLGCGWRQELVSQLGANLSNNSTEGSL